MEKIDFLKKLQSELEIEEKLKESTRFKELAEWDSMTAMVLIGFVADNFEVNLNGKDIQGIHTIAELIEKIGVENINS